MHARHCHHMIHAAARQVISQRVGKILFIARQKRLQKASGVRRKDLRAYPLEPLGGIDWEIPQRARPCFYRQLALCRRAHPDPARGVILVALQIVRACRAQLCRTRDMVAGRKHLVRRAVQHGADTPGLCLHANKNGTSIARACRIFQNLRRNLCLLPRAERLNRTKQHCPIDPAPCKRQRQPQKRRQKPLQMKLLPEPQRQHAERRSNCRQKIRTGAKPRHARGAADRKAGCEPAQAPHFLRSVSPSR